MTAPKQHLPNQIVHLVRRTSQRQFLLVNDKKGASKNAAGYLYAVAAKKHGQLPHAVTVMSNHLHLCQTDTTGKRARFMQEFHGLYARIINTSLQRRDSVWSCGEPGNTWLLDTKEVADTMVYIWMNPVKAGLVERVEHWDHFQILPRHWGKTMRFQRPDFFRDNAPNKPEFIEFTPMPPAPFAHIPLEKLVEYFEKRIAEEEEKCMYERRAKKKSVEGMEKCYAVKPRSTPKTKVAMFTKNPRFASTRPEFIIHAIEGLKGFWRLYKRRIEALRKGCREKFPAGAVLLPQLLGIACFSIDEYPELRIEYEPFTL